MPRYKCGKVTTPIDFEQFADVMEHGDFKNPSHRSFLSFLYWFGVRLSEALERVKEDFRLEDGVLYVNAPAKKKGQRIPLDIDVDLPYVSLIVKQWKKTRAGKRLWPFSPRTAQYIVKRAMGEKYYPHFFRLNRAVFFLDDPSTTLPEMKAWFGWKKTATVDYYMGFSQRHVDRQRMRLRNQAEK